MSAAPEPSPTARGRRAYWEWSLLLVVSTGLLTFVLSRVELAKVGHVLANADLALLLVAMLFSTTAFSVLPTLRWRGTLRALGYPLRFLTLLFARYGSQPLKFTIPLKGGEAFRAAYLRRRHGVPSTTAVASILFDMFLVAVGQLPLVCLGLIVAGEPVGRALLPTALLLLGALGLSSRRMQLLGLAVARRISGKLASLAEQLVQGFLSFPASTKVRLTLLSYLVEGSELLSMYLCFRVVGLEVPLWAVLVYMPIVTGITLIPITISGLGTRELGIVFLFASHGTPEQLTGAALLFTTLEFIWPALVGCTILSPFLSALRQPAVAIAPPSPIAGPGPIWTFLAQNKRWWLLPMALVFAGFLVLWILTSTGAVAPFVY